MKVISSVRNERNIEGSCMHVFLAVMNFLKLMYLFEMLITIAIKALIWKIHNKVM